MLNFEKSVRIDAALPMSGFAMPASKVAQNTKSCSLAMSRTLPALTSVKLPSRPWP